MASYRFLEFELSEEDFTLSRGGQRIALEPKALRVLTLLVSRGGHLVDKQELLSSVWPNTFVEESTLTRTIGILRRELGDSSRDSRIIETVPTRGYRFIAPVETLPQPSQLDSMIASAEKGTKTNPAPSVRVRPATFLLMALCAVAIMTLGANFLIHRANGKHGAKTEHHVTEQRVTSNSPEAPVDFAVISPDGKFVAYSDPTGLYLRVIASGELRRWDLPKDFIAKPNSWFPDGTHLLVMRWAGTPPTPSLWKLSLLGAAPQKLIDNAVAGSVSPDGTRIAFGSFLPSWGSELWVMNADGSNPHKIAEASQRANPPSGILSSAWSLNSRRIACIERYGFAGLTPAAELSSLWTRDAEGGDLQVIFNNNWLGPALAWAPDGRILFATRSNPASERDDEDIRSIRVDERSGKAVGQQQVVTTGAGPIGGISVTSDGKRLTLLRTNSREQAFISEFDANTRKWKTPRRLTLDANGNQATAWLSDSKTVLFVSNRTGTWTLYKQAIDETTAEVLVEGHSLYHSAVKCRWFTSALRITNGSGQPLYSRISDAIADSRRPAPISRARCWSWELPVRTSAFHVVHRSQTPKERLHFSFVRPASRNRARTFADPR